MSEAIHRCIFIFIASLHGFDKDTNLEFFYNKIHKSVALSPQNRKTFHTKILLSDIEAFIIGALPSLSAMFISAESSLKRISTSLL